MTTLAFFDYDDTLSCGDSILYWNCFLFEQRPDLRKHRWMVYLGVILWCLKIISTHTLKRFQLKATSHLSPDERTELAHQFVTTVLPRFLFPEMIGRMKSHRELGHRVIVVSASADFYMNQELMSLIIPCDEVVGTHMEFPESGLIRLPKYTRENFKGPKKVEVLQSMEQFPEYAEGCFAYSDHYSDRFLLEYTEFPQAVNPDKELETLALEKNWPIWKPFRLKNGRTRSLWKLQMLLFAKGMDHNFVPSGLAWRSQILNEWMESWKSWIVGDGSWNEFWRYSQLLKGMPLELAIEEIWLRHDQVSLPLISTAQYLEGDTIGDSHSSPKECLPYCTWKPLRPELINPLEPSMSDVKIPVRGVREMMGLDRRFIEMNLSQSSLSLLKASPFFEARLERISQLLKRDYQADKEIKWAKELNMKSFPSILELTNFQILEDSKEPVLIRENFEGINLTKQVEGQALSALELESFLHLTKEILAYEVMPQIRFGQVWRFQRGTSPSDHTWKSLDPNSMTPLVVGQGQQFSQWLQGEVDIDKASCFEGIHRSTLKTQYQSIQQSSDETLDFNEILKEIFKPLWVGSFNEWNFYAQASSESLSQVLGSLNPMCFDIAMNLLELYELRTHLRDQA